MSKIKSFFEELKSSFFGPSFYASTRDKSFGASVGFLFLSTLLVSTSVVIVGAAFTISSLLSIQPSSFIEENFPTELSVSIKDGKASTSAQEPYIIPIPEDERVKNSTFENYLVIDTRPETTVQALEEYKAVAVVTKESLYINQDGGEGRVIALSELGEDVTFDKPFLTSAVQGLMTFLWVIVPLLIIFGAPLFAFIMTGFYLFVSIFGAVIPLLIAKLRKIPMTYEGAYKTALYATVPIMFLTSAWLFLGVGAFPPFLDILLFAFLLTLNLKAKKESRRDSLDGTPS
ncbi:DUF1189 domain-containing protein [Patescibacteria group bacterium]|nr:DUF1189 domain-containing protein [Patescibacteria group bacterium]